MLTGTKAIVPLNGMNSTVCLNVMSNFNLLLLAQFNKRGPQNNHSHNSTHWHYSSLRHHSRHPDFHHFHHEFMFIEHYSVLGRYFIFVCKPQPLWSRTLLLVMLFPVELIKVYVFRAVVLDQLTNLTKLKWRYVQTIYIHCLAPKKSHY